MCCRTCALPPGDQARLAPVLAGLLADQLEDAAAELQRRYFAHPEMDPMTQLKPPIDHWPGSTGCRPLSHGRRHGAVGGLAGVGDQHGPVLPGGPQLLGLAMEGNSSHGSGSSSSSSSGQGPAVDTYISNELVFDSREEL